MNFIPLLSVMHLTSWLLCSGCCCVNHALLCSMAQHVSNPWHFFHVLFKISQYSVIMTHFPESIVTNIDKHLRCPSHVMKITISRFVLISQLCILGADIS